MKKRTKFFVALAAIAGVLAVAVHISNRREKEKSLDADNPYLSQKVAKSIKHNLYTDCLKRVIDIALSFFGIIILSPLYAFISLAIIIDDLGPVLFTQKRVGKNKEFFELHNVFKTVSEVTLCNKVPKKVA